MYQFSIKSKLLLLLIIHGRYYSRSSLSSINRISNNPIINKVKFFYNDIYEVKLPINHKFPMSKYRIVRETLQNEYKNNANIIFEESPKITRPELITTHCPIYIDNYINGNLSDLEIRKQGFPWDISNVNRSLSSVGGTVAAMRTVLNNPNINMAGHIAGGMYFKHIRNDLL